MSFPARKTLIISGQNFELFDFELTDAEMDEIAALNKNKRYYTSTPEMLKGYAAFVPPVDEQK